jgi:hypothetical protein
MNYLDVMLWILAAPIYLAKGLFRLWRKWKFWRVAYTPRIVCASCRGTIWLVGLWRCGCGYTYRGHLLRACPVCGSLPRMVRCYECGVTQKLLEP